MASAFSTLPRRPNSRHLPCCTLFEGPALAKPEDNFRQRKRKGERDCEDWASRAGNRASIAWQCGGPATGLRKPQPPPGPKKSSGEPKAFEGLLCKEVIPRSRRASPDLCGVRWQQS
jgi:hypothetical protein